MKVDISTQNKIQTPDVSKKTSGEKILPSAQASLAGQKDGAFNVQISDKVKEMMTSVPTEDDIRLDKVAAIREQLAKGNYNISGKDVADKILNALKS